MRLIPILRLSRPGRVRRPHTGCLLLACFVLCTGVMAAAPALGDDARNAPRPSSEEPFTLPFEALWEPWTGDLPGMVERRLLRVVVPYGGYQF